MNTTLYKFRFHLLSAFFMLAGNATQAQDWKKDLLEMNKVYLDASAFNMDIHVQVFSNINDSKPAFDYDGQVASKIDNYYTSMMGRITITNKRCVLVVDNAQKIIMYKKMTDDMKKQGGFSIANIDSAIVLMDKNVNINVKYLRNDTEEIRVEITYKEGSISKAELAIDPKNHTLKEVVYYYTKEDPDNQAAKVTITYKNIVLNKSMPDDFFSESNYVSHKKDTVVPLKKYEGYEVVSQNNL